MSRQVRLGSWTIQPHKEQWDVSARWKHSPVSFGTEYSLLVHECHCLVTDACAGPRQRTTSLSFGDEMRLFIRFRLHVLKLFTTLGSSWSCPRIKTKALGVSTRENAALE
jgi:hypothetical protein